MQVTCRQPTLVDAAAVHTLIRECKPLDLNSPYAYMLLCTHFANTCALAEHNGGLLGFVSGYRKPVEPAVLFVWQVAVGSPARGFGVGKRLLRELLSRSACAGVEYLETTVTPSNNASRALFESFARENGAACESSIAFRSGDFGQNHHEEEHLLRIGPLAPLPNDGVHEDKS